MPATNLNCPHFPSSPPPRPHSPHPRRCSTCGRAVRTPERSGTRGSAPPQKVGAPTRGSAHMSLAGRFFPSTMRMDSELRLAIAGPRRGMRVRESRTPGSGAAGGQRGTGRRVGGGPRQAREVSAGAGESLPLHSPPPPPHVRGPVLPGGPIGGGGSPAWAGPAQTAAFIGCLGGWEGPAPRSVALLAPGRRGARGRRSAPGGLATGMWGRRAWSQCQFPGSPGQWALVCTQRRGQVRGHAGRGRARRTALATGA